MYLPIYGPVTPNFFGIAERKRGTLRAGLVSVVPRGSTLWEIPKKWVTRDSPPLLRCSCARECLADQERSDRE